VTVPIGGGDLATSDSFAVAYRLALPLARAKASDAVLMTGGGSGGTLTEAPDLWSLTFLSPKDRRMWMVMVEDGVSRGVKDMGIMKDAVEPSSAVAYEGVKVSATDAVTKARGFARQSGEVPPDVMVFGAFMRMDALVGSGAEPGKWTVTFLEGIDPSTGRMYSVDMITGAVEAAKRG
jgi:hypothetical protein